MICVYVGEPVLAPHGDPEIPPEDFPRIVIDEREEQLSNALLPILVTLLGMMMDEREEEYWNA